jgi:antitoxin PrlF
MVDLVTRVTRKGQTTIPVEIRRELGISEGDRVQWVREGDRYFVAPAEGIARRTAGMLYRYRLDRPPTIQEMKDAAHQAIVDDVVAELQD